MKVYIAGPMSGLPDHNFPAFERMAERLRTETRHEVVSPRELGPATEADAAAMPWDEHLRRDLRGLLECDAVALLPAWGNSLGATLEALVASQTGMLVYYAEDLLYENRNGPAQLVDVQTIVGHFRRLRSETGALPAQVAVGEAGPEVVRPIDCPPECPAAQDASGQVGHVHRKPDDRVVDPTTGAVKADGGKPRTDLLPVAPLLDIAEVFRFGAAKYADRNWERGFDWSRPYGALLRHLFLWWGGQDDDGETGLSHLAHAACCLLMLMEYRHSLAGKDDRPYRVGEYDGGQS